MIDDRVALSLLLVLLDGAQYANAMRRNGQPCRIKIPDDTEARAGLVDAHLRGVPMSLTFLANGYEPWRERVDAVALTAYCPRVDGRCGWVGIDLDAADHGERGLDDPVRATRCIAERADAAGLASGLLVARSRGGLGRHVFLMLSEPVVLKDAVIGVAALAAAAFRIAASDVAECDSPHAFRCANGAIACPGDAGSVELVPRSTTQPRFGWALALPRAGAFAARGGGVIVDPFEDQPIPLECVPRCDPAAWIRFIAEARARLKRSVAAPLLSRRITTFKHQRFQPIDRIDPRTRTFLDGHASEGTRNVSAFSASANLLGCGMDEREAERLVLAGAAACGLPECEARSAFQSAARAIARRGGRQ